MAQPAAQTSALSPSFVDVQQFYRSLDGYEIVSPKLKDSLQRKSKANALHMLRPSLEALCGQLHSETDIVSAARALANTWALSTLPLPGAGETDLRIDILSQLGACDLALARLLQAHTDAQAILQEAGLRPRAHALYGTWTARHATQPLRARHSAAGWQLSGVLPLCLGARQVDRALVAADAGADRLLFDINVLACNDIEEAHAERERMPTANIIFDAVRLEDRALVGPPNFVAERRGAWASAIDTAACQLGGAIGLLRAWLKLNCAEAADTHALANLGASFASIGSAALQLARNAQFIDEDKLPCVLSLSVLETRYAIEQACKEVMQRMNRTLSPQQNEDADLNRRCADLGAYLRQSHSEHTLEDLGGRVLSEQSAGAFKTVYSWL